MAVKKSKSKKYYTVEEANAMLPLLRSILRDITELAGDLKERHERLAKVKVPAGNVYSEEVERVHAEFEHDQEKLNEYIQELGKLKVELKDPFLGLIDFLCMKDGREVYLCWRLGEPEVGFWHDTDKGFANRQQLNKE